MAARPVWRVRGRASFTALRRSGRRVRRGAVTVVRLPAPAGSPPRVAYAIGRAAGGAVDRNRVRRRLRAVIDDLGPTLDSGTYLVSAGREAATVPFATLRAQVAAAVEASRGAGGPR